MLRRPATIALGLLLAGLAGSAVGSPAQAAPLALSVGLIPASGPAGMTVTAVGSSWTLSNNPYIIFWEVAGGTQLGTFTPDGSGAWSKSITIPGGASNGSHTVVACEGYGGEFQGCASAGFNVTSPTATPSRTPTRTPSRTPTTAPPGFVTPTFTLTPTSPYGRGCIDGIERISPTNYDDLAGAATADLVMEVVMGDPTTQHVLVHLPRSFDIYTQWPDPTPGTTVEAVPDPVEANRWRLTVRDYPVVLGYNQIQVDLDPTCWGSRSMYYQFNNGIEPTLTPRPDACGGLGLPSDATVITFDTYSGTDSFVERVARDQGVRFEGSLRLHDPSAVEPRSGWYAAASIEGLEFGSAMLPIRMAFERPLQALGLFVGMEEALYVTGEVHAVLSAYGYHGASSDLVLLGSDSTSFPAAATDVVYCLRYTAAEGDIIARALVEYTDASGGSIAERRLIDDLTLVYAEAELPPDEPPVVEITSPADGSSLPGTTVYLRSTIREDRELASVRYQIDGGPETAIGAAPSTTDPTSYFTGVNFSASLLTPGVPHILTISATDRAGQFATDSVTIIIPTPVPTIDIQAVKMEVVQVVQCLDNTHCADNAVPMVINKPTWVRVYLRSEGGVPRAPVSGRLCRGRVGTCDTGFVIPINQVSPDGDEDPSRTDRGNLDASLNFMLPPVWLSEGTLELTAFVNYHEENMDETRDDNNAVQAAVPVVPARSLTVMFMPVTADGRTAAISEMWNFADWLARVFPVARITAIARGPLPGDRDLSDSSGDGCGRTWNGLMDALRGAYTWRGPGTGYLFGLVPGDADTAGIGGCGEVPGRIASGITTGGTRWGPVIGAQELGHNFGRHHATRCGGADNPDSGYPVRNGILDDWGIDLTLRQVYPRLTSYDYMGYCGGADNTWTSAYTYMALLRTLPVAQTVPSGAHLAALMAAGGPPQLVGGGTISPDGFTLEHGFYRASLAEGVEDDLPQGPYSVQLLDSEGALLYERDFGLIELSNHTPTQAGSFQIILPDVAGTSEIVFLYNGGFVGSASASANAPQVRLVAPAGGEDWGESGAHAIAWEASDADGDALRFNVQYSSDGGTSWSSLDVDLSGATSLTVESADLPGGSLLFRVLASDGLNQAESASSVPVTIGNKPPMIHLASPLDGEWWPAGEAVILRGYAADLEDVVLDDGAYRWTSDRDGELGQGPTLWGLPLSQGDHHITMTVTDRGGRSESQSVRIIVGTVEEARPQRPPIVGLLLLAGGVLVLGSVAGILFFMARARRS
jgi:Bacterial Ig domain